MKKTAGRGQAASRKRPPSRRTPPSALGVRANGARREHHARTRARILQYAHHLYGIDGYASVSMRALARRLRFSAQAIYYYFPSKEAMFAALADEGLRLLELQHPSEELPDVLDNLRLPYLRYYEFSKAHAVYFTLLWMDPVAAVTQQEAQLALIRRMSEDTRQRIQRCINEGVFPADLDIRLASQLLTSAVHGAAVIGLTGRPAPAERADVLATTLLDATIEVLRSGRVTRALSPLVPARASGSSPPPLPSRRGLQKMNFTAS